MNINDDQFNFLANIVKEGLIFIDNDGIIKLYNKKAKEIFGIENQWAVGHPSGAINKGDFVIIADNNLGKDDGGLLPIDLKNIGIPEDEVNLGDIILATGFFNKQDLAPVFSRWENTCDFSVYELNSKFNNLDIFIRIDRNNNTIQIRVSDQIYTMNYINSIGHMVIIDKDTQAVKFFQASGYTARGESIKSILNGSSFREKSKISEFDVIGKSIFDIHENGKTIQEFYDVSKGAVNSFVDEFTEINGFPVLCSLVPFEKNGVRRGAVLKVEDISSLKRALDERDEALSYAQEIQHLLDENMSSYDDFTDFLGESPEIQNVKKFAYKASKTNSTVLLLGESGTGKTILSKCIHNASNRKSNAFVHVNCAAMPEMLLESELFGHEKGSFTGAATTGKEGLFKKADGGTIFLDEIGEISLSSQVKLLKVLQNKTFFKIGGTEEIKVDVRIILATNKSLESAIKRGDFREDLYYRINVFPILIPPLRDRKSDIEILASKLTKQICEKLGLPTKFVTAAFQSALADYDWPGNVRELENILERAINITDELLIDTKCLPPNIFKILDEKDMLVRKSLKDLLEEAEKKALIDALKVTGNDKMLVMNMLKIGKTNFYDKLKKYNLL